MASGDTMTNTNRAYGLGLAAGALCLFFTGMFHPNVSRAMGSAEALQAFLWTNTAVHGLAIVGAWLSLFGVTGLSRHLGMAHPVNVAALIAYFIGVVLVCCAATMDGLVIPELLRRAQGADEVRRAALWPMIGFASAAASSLTTVYVAAVSLAMLIWSGILHTERLARGLVWSGIPVAILGLAGLMSGLLKLNLHGLLVVVIAQGAWFVAAGLWLSRRAERASVGV